MRPVASQLTTGVVRVGVAAAVTVLRAPSIRKWARIANKSILGRLKSGKKSVGTEYTYIYLQEDVPRGECGVFRQKASCSSGELQ